MMKEKKTRDEEQERNEIKARACSAFPIYLFFGNVLSLLFFLNIIYFNAVLFYFFKMKTCVSLIL